MPGGAVSFHDNGGTWRVPERSGSRARGAYSFEHANDVVLGWAYRLLLICPRTEWGILWCFHPDSYCFLNQSCFRRAKGAVRGSATWASQRHSSLFRFTPHCGQRPRQSLRQITFIGSARSTCSASTSARKSPSPSKNAISVSSNLSRSSSSFVIEANGRYNKSNSRATSSSTGSDHIVA